MRYNENDILPRNITGLLVMRPSMRSSPEARAWINPAKPNTLAGAILSTDRQTAISNTEPSDTTRAVNASSGPM